MPRGSRLAKHRVMNGACMATPMGFEFGNQVPGIELFWERLPANEVEQDEPILEELDLREYFVELLVVEDLAASAGADIWL